MRAVLCGLLLVATVNACAEERQISLDWLKVVAFAAHQTDYSGVFVYQYGNHVETSRITHIVEADGEYEKLESLDGPKREIIRHHGQVWCYINHKMVQVDSQQVRSRFPALLPEQISTLSANYHAKEVGMERVAGYNAQVFLFKPNDNLRYVHKMWAHADSGLLLKAAVLDAKSEMIEQYAFTQLQIGGSIDRSWIDAKSLPQRDVELHMPPVTVKGGVPASSGWVVGALPPGFKKIMEIQRSMRSKHAPVTQMVFSDGLSAISIFIEPDDGDEDDVEGLSSRGAVNLYHKVLEKHLITVVGEVPPRTVMQVLDSVRYNAK
ncbi:MAG: MucB/RseB C-terminal domain-containing protein [Gallionella sp.]